MKKIICYIFVLFFYVYNVFGEEINKKSSIYLNTDAKEFNFKADTVEYDSKNDVIIAKGNVVITHDGDIITADKLLINKKNNLVFAEGNIYYKDKNKNDVYADSLELSEDMGKIVINNVSMLIENNYLYADKLTNKDNTTNLINSCFTLCKINYHSRPFVSTKAKKATYNEKTQILTMYNSVVTVKDIPIFWMPVIIQNVSNNKVMGFLDPEFKKDSLGYILSTPFYIPISDYQNLYIIPDIVVNDSQKSMGSFKYQASFINTKLDLYTGIASYREIDNLQKDKKTNKWFVFGSGEVDLSNIFRIKFNLENFKDVDTIYKYDINSKNSEEKFMYNNFVVEGFLNEKNYITVGGDFNYLLDSKGTPKYEYASPFVNYKYINQKIGLLNFSLDARILNNMDENLENNNSIEKNIMTRVVNQLDYSYFFSDELFGNIKTDINLQSAMFFHDNKNYSTSQYLGVGGSITYDLPFIININEVNNIVVKPITQITYSQKIIEQNLELINDTNTNDVFYNSFDSIFSLNRDGNLNVYKNGNFFNFGLSMDFNITNNLFITSNLIKSTGLKNEKSDYAINDIYLFNTRIKIIQNITIDESLELSAEHFKINNNVFIINFSVNPFNIGLKHDLNLNSTNYNENDEYSILTPFVNFKLNKNIYIQYSADIELKNDANKGMYKSDLSLVFQNECVNIYTSLSSSFYYFNNKKIPDNSFSIKLKLKRL